MKGQNSWASPATPALKVHHISNHKLTQSHLMWYCCGKKNHTPDSSKPSAANETLESCVLLTQKLHLINCTGMYVMLKKCVHRMMIVQTARWMPLLVDVRVEGQQLNMKIDTEATLLWISEASVNKPSGHTNACSPLQLSPRHTLVCPYMYGVVCGCGWNVVVTKFSCPFLLYNTLSIQYNSYGNYTVQWKIKQIQVRTR